MASDQTADVAIVGCGPVGQVLAILLGQSGWHVRVLERWPAPYPLPRAVHFDHEVARVLQAAGVAAALAPITEPASVYEWRNAAGDVLMRIGRDAETSPSGWPESTMFCQPELERILDAQAKAIAAGGTGLEHDAEFHAAIGAAAHNRAITRIAHAVMDLLRQSREESLNTPGRPDRSHNDHRRLLTAIRARDEAAARQAMVEHLEAVEALVLGTENRRRSP